MQGHTLKAFPSCIPANGGNTLQILVPITGVRGGPQVTLTLNPPCTNQHVYIATTSQDKQGLLQEHTSHICPLAPDKQTHTCAVGIPQPKQILFLCINI